MRTSTFLAAWAALLTSVLLLSGCGSDATPTPVAAVSVPTATAAPPTDTPVPTATATATPTDTPAPTATPTPDLAATTVAAAVIATLTAEAQATPTPVNWVEPVAEAAFAEWAAYNGEPYRDVQVTEESNDSFFATVRVLAWFRPTADTPWEEREALVECRQVGGAWQCDSELRFALSEGEVGRRSATATAVAAPTVTAEAIAQATAQAQATATVVAQATAIAGIIERTSEEILIPAGEFTLGCVPDDNQCDDDEFPKETFSLDAFYIDKYEVTNARYKACVDAGACETPGRVDTHRYNATNDDHFEVPYFGTFQYADYPVIFISWEMAVAFCTWEGKRLPTVLEWWKAALGTDWRNYPWGNHEPDPTLLNYNRNAGGTTPVGAYPNGASPYGVMDMYGNVWEWSDAAVDAWSSDRRSLLGGNWDSSNLEYRHRANIPNFNEEPDSIGNQWGIWGFGFRCAHSQ